MDVLEVFAGPLICSVTLCLSLFALVTKLPQDPSREYWLAAMVMWTCFNVSLSYSIELSRLHGQTLYLERQLHKLERKYVCNKGDRQADGMPVGTDTTAFTSNKIKVIPSRRVHSLQCMSETLSSHGLRPADAARRCVGVRLDRGLEQHGTCWGGRALLGYQPTYSHLEPLGFLVNRNCPLYFPRTLH